MGAEGAHGKCLAQLADYRSVQIRQVVLFLLLFVGVNILKTSCWFVILK